MSPPQLDGWWAICLSFSWFLCFQPLKSMSFRLFRLHHQYLEIHVIQTLCSCLSITLCYSHTLRLDSCVALDAVFTRVVYGATTQPRVPCVWPTPGKSLGARCIKTYKGMTLLKLWNIRIHFLSPCQLYTSHSWRKSTLFPLPPCIISLLCFTLPFLICGERSILIPLSLTSFHCLVEPCLSRSVETDQF